MFARYSYSFPFALLPTLCLAVAPSVSEPVPPPASSTGRPEPKLFTLRSDKLTLSQALSDLTKQTGIRVENLRAEPDSPLSLDLKQRTFWQALDSIADAGGARVLLYPTTGRIVLDRRDPAYRPPPISYDGRFRISVKKTTTSRDLEANAGDPRGGSATVSLEVAWDPELQPLYLETRPRGVRLVDDRGQTYAVPEEGSSLAPVDGRIAQGIDLHLPALPRTVGKIRSLGGELSMIGPSKMLTFRFDAFDRLAAADPNDPERRLTQEGVSCHVLKVTIERERWSVRVALDYPPGMKQLDTNQSWVVNNEMVLESPDGKKRFPAGNYVVESATARRAVLSYHFRDRGELVRGKPGDWKLRYRTPADLIEAPIRFAFKDVPLP